MKHKVGDTVRIKSKAWIDAQPKDYDEFDVEGNNGTPLAFVDDMFVYAGQSFQITDIYTDSNYELGDMADWEWSDAMLEDDSYIEDLQKRVADLEAEVAVLKGENKQDDPIVYNSNKHYVAMWDEQPFLLKCSDQGGHELQYTFVGMYITPHRLSDTFDSGQEALNDARTCMGDSDDQPVLYVFDTGKEALEFMLKYL